MGWKLTEMVQVSWGATETLAQLFVVKEKSAVSGPVSERPFVSRATEPMFDTVTSMGALALFTAWSGKGMLVWLRLIIALVASLKTTASDPPPYEACKGLAVGKSVEYVKPIT